MRIAEENIRIIFGLKLKQKRSEAGISLDELAHKVGISKSYLNEIEKGKKYPKTPKVAMLAEALNTSYDELVSLNLDKQWAPLTYMLNSNFLQHLPLEHFGLEPAKIVEVIANAPSKANALINTLIEIARNYNMTQEHFYFAALRSYQENHNNFFEDLEEASEKFRKDYLDPDAKWVRAEELQRILEEEHGYLIDTEELSKHEPLSGLRSVYVPTTPPRLMLNPNLSDSQKAFVFGKELGYLTLGFKERPYTSSWIKVDSFDRVLNNFKASYFSGALLLDRKLLKKDLKAFFERKEWSSAEFRALMEQYTSSPETFMSRLTNILPQYFGLGDLFFLRFNHEHDTAKFELTKELHLSRLHEPHGSEIDEHYCRRWVSLGVLNRTEQKRKAGTYKEPIVDAQISEYLNSKDRYLVIAMARPMARKADADCSVSIGLRLNQQMKKRVAFWNDPGISVTQVNETCEDCPLTDCEERAVPPSRVMEKASRKRKEEALQELLRNYTGGL